MIVEENVRKCSIRMIFSPFLLDYGSVHLFVVHLLFEIRFSVLSRYRLVIVGFGDQSFCIH